MEQCEPQGAAAASWMFPARDCCLQAPCRDSAAGAEAPSGHTQAIGSSFFMSASVLSSAPHHPDQLQDVKALGSQQETVRQTPFNNLISGNLRKKICLGLAKVMYVSDNPKWLSL